MVRYTRSKVTRKTPTTRSRSDRVRGAHGASGSSKKLESHWGIIGNTPIVERLRRTITIGPDIHAFLLSGTSGIGKTTLATSLTNALICSAPIEGNACQTCKDCTFLLQHRHPDVISVTDGDETIGIEHVRGITASLQRRPTVSSRHVVQIDRIERMTEEASNAFLKTLEEPYGATMFVLTTDRPHLVPFTILSRCSVFHCTQVPEHAIKDHLIDTGVATVDARHIAAVADGRPAYALRLARQREVYDQAREDAESLLALIGAVPYERIRIAETIAAHKEGSARMSAVLNCWESTIRRMLRIAVGLPDHGPGAETIRALVTSMMTVPAIIGLARQLQTMRERIRTSGNIRLNIESFSLHLPTSRL